MRRSCDEEDDELPISSAETYCAPRSQPPSLRPSVLLGGNVDAAAAAASDARIKAESCAVALQEAADAADVALAEVESKLRALEVARASKEAADVARDAAGRALDVANAAAAAAAAAVEHEEASAAAQMIEMVDRVVVKILDGAVEEVAQQLAQARAAAAKVVEQQQQYELRRGELPLLVQVSFDADDKPILSPAAVPAAPPGTTTGRTLFHDILGAGNVLRARIQEGERGVGCGVSATRSKAREHSLLDQGLTLDGRRFHVAAFKEDNEGVYVFVAQCGRSWHPFTGPISWESAQAARQLFADFENIAQLPKYTMRPSLLLSQTSDLRSVLERRLYEDVADEALPPGLTSRVLVRSLGGDDALADLGAPPTGCLQVIELDDLRADDGSETTDGGGILSADLASSISTVTRGRAASHAAEGITSERPTGGPLITQMRLYYHGCVSKGTLLRSAVLPERTIVLRRSMVKVRGRAGCAARDFWAFEVVGTSKRSREARFNSKRRAARHPRVAALLSPPRLLRTTTLSLLSPLIHVAAQSTSLCMHLVRAPYTCTLYMHLIRAPRGPEHLVVLLEALGGDQMVHALLAIAHCFSERLLQGTRPPMSLSVLSKLAEHDMNDIEQVPTNGPSLGSCRTSRPHIVSPHSHSVATQVPVGGTVARAPPSFPHSHLLLSPWSWPDRRLGLGVRVRVRARVKVRVRVRARVKVRVRVRARLRARARARARARVAAKRLGLRLGSRLGLGLGLGLELELGLRPGVGRLGLGLRAAPFVMHSPHLFCEPLV